MECHALEEAKAGDFTIFPRFVVDLTVFFPSGVGMHGGFFSFFLEFRLLATIVEVDSFKRL
jgi:hypothetical protein